MTQFWLTSRLNRPAPPRAPAGEVIVNPGRVALYGETPSARAVAVALPPLLRLKYVQPPASVVPATVGNRALETGMREVSGVVAVVVGGGGETMMPPVKPLMP